MEGIGNPGFEAIRVRDEPCFSRSRHVAREGVVFYRELAVRVVVLVRKEIVTKKCFVLHTDEPEPVVIHEEYGSCVGAANTYGTNNDLALRRPGTYTGSRRYS